MFLKTLPTDIVTSLSTKITNIELSLNKLLNETQKETTITPAGDAPAISDNYLASYKTVMEQFNEALSITAEELLAFKTKIIYQQGDIINGNNDKMSELFSDINLNFNDKLDVIIRGLNNLIENQQKINPLNQDKTIFSVNTLINNISKTNDYLDKLLSVNIETNSLLKTNSVENKNTNNENEFVALGNKLVEGTNKPVEIPPINVYYNVPDEPSDREQLADIFEYVHNNIDTVNGEELPVETDDELSEQTDKLIRETIKTNDNIINRIFNTDIINGTLFSEFKTSFDNFTEKNTSLLTKIFEKTESINNKFTESTVKNSLITELTKELRSLNNQLVTINTAGSVIKHDNINKSAGEETEIETEIDEVKKIPQVNENNILNDKLPSPEIIGNIPIKQSSIINQPVQKITETADNNSISIKIDNLANTIEKLFANIVNNNSNVEIPEIDVALPTVEPNISVESNPQITPEITLNNDLSEFATSPDISVYPEIDVETNIPTDFQDKQTVEKTPITKSEISYEPIEKILQSISSQLIGLISIDGEVKSINTKLVQIPRKICRRNKTIN